MGGDFMRQYGAALEGTKVQASNIGAGRTIAGTVNALIVVYLDPQSSSPFKTGAPETQRTRRNILENFRKTHGDKPLFQTDKSGRRTMLLTSTCSGSSTRRPVIWCGAISG
jgi:hypothetical protein